MRLGEIMRRDVVTIDGETPLPIAAHQMLSSGVRHLPVLARGGLVGVLSVRDLGRPRRRVPGGTAAACVHDAMSAPAIVAHESTTVDEAVELMTGAKIGCLPILDGHELVGIVTTSDLVACSPGLAARPARVVPTTVRSIACAPPIVARPGDPLFEALARIARQGASEIPVVDDAGRLVGMLREEDARRAIGERSEARNEVERMATMTVADAMSAPRAVVTSDTPLPTVRSVLADAHAASIPVVDHHAQLVGVVTCSAVIAALAEARALERRR